MKKNQMEILELINLTSDLKTSLEELNNRFELAEKGSRTFKDRLIAFIQFEE